LSEYQAKATMLPGDAVVDEDENVNVAFVRINARTGDVGLMWLPDMFKSPLPSPVREAIVSALRFYADKIESGEMERIMQKFIHVNDPLPEE
jgi:hypothetical protein